jgi:hypothetical protein
MPSFHSLTELPLDHVPESHKEAFALLQHPSADNITQLLQTVDFLFKEIPEPLLPFMHHARLDCFNENQWVFHEILEFQRWFVQDKHFQCQMAAAMGRLSWLKLARELGCPWGDSCKIAAEAGFLHILEWAKGHFSMTWRSYLPSITIAAAEAGQVHVLKWLWENKELPSDQELALFQGGADAIRYLQLIYPDFLVTLGLMTVAIDATRMEVVQFLREIGYEFHHVHMERASKSGRLGFAVWLYTEGCPWASSFLEEAAAIGDLVLIEWAFHHGCPVTDRVCIMAALRGQVDVLKWANKKGYFLNTDTIIEEGLYELLMILPLGNVEELVWDDAEVRNRLAYVVEVAKKYVNL